ncbi:DUF397 domain-containing protein [Actinomadura verrucosospora]|uniref:Regulatory protein n=1 Tax=Actinomadura verrucosospora TaxID=46165 RepID=A0A7D3ZGK5_ACTVE|nr:DUF397 domain-containing protein [Actinomadura verrucosospora]QKG23077.1 regulatory protein [Actinomadura verrucosospora]
MVNMSEAAWRKSSYTGPNGGDCVELASVPGTVAVRDSKDPDGPKLVFGRRAFTSFLTSIKR